MSVLKEVKNLNEKRNQVTKERNEAEKANALAVEVEENYKGRHVKKSHKLRNAFMLMFAGLGVLMASVALYKDNQRLKMPKEEAPAVRLSEEDKTNTEEKQEEKKENVVTKGNDRSNTVTYDRDGKAKADLEDKKTYGGEKEPNKKETETEIKGNKTNEFEQKNEDKLEKGYKDIEIIGEEQEKEQQDKEEEKVPSQDEQESQNKGDSNIQQEEKEPEQTEKGTATTDSDRISEFEDKIEWER